MGKAHWGTTALPGVVKVQHKRVEVVWETLPPHPVVMAETTADHQKIRFLHPHNGVMLIGYGDWNDNLGPVSVIGYDLETLAPVTLFGPCPTEAFDRIRVFDGDVYLPWVDPTVGNQGGMTTDRSGSWENVEIGDNTSMIHTFDLAMIGGKVHACGSAPHSPGNGVGTVWREDAPGVWTEALRGTHAEPFSRFYAFKDMGDGRWRVQNTAGGVETYETTGTNWTPVTDAAWTSTPYWGADASDPPGPLPAGWPDPLGTRAALLAYEGWVYVAGTGGRVKRARLPE